MVFRGRKADVMPTAAAQLEPRTDERPGMYGSDIEEMRRNFITALGTLTGMGEQVEELLRLATGAVAGDQQALEVMTRVGVVATAGAKRSEALTERVEGLATTLSGKLGEVGAALGRIEATLQARAEAEAKEAAAKGRGAGVGQRLEGKIDAATQAIVGGQHELNTHVTRALEEIRRAVAAGSTQAQGQTSTTQAVDRVVGRLGKMIKERGQTKTGRRTWLAGRCRIVEAGAGATSGGGREELPGAVEEADAGRAKGGVAVVVAIGRAAEVAQADAKMAEEAARQKVFVVDAQSLESFVRTANAAQPAGGQNPAVVTDLVVVCEEIRAVGAELRAVQGSGPARHRLASLLGTVDKIRERVGGGANTNAQGAGAGGAGAVGATPAPTNAGTGASTTTAVAPGAGLAEQAHAAQPTGATAGTQPDDKAAAPAVAGTPNAKALSTEARPAETPPPVTVARAEAAAAQTESTGVDGARGEPHAAHASAQTSTNRTQGQSQAGESEQKQKKQSLSMLVQPPPAAATAAVEMGRSSWENVPAEATA